MNCQQIENVLAARDTVENLRFMLKCKPNGIKWERKQKGRNSVKWRAYIHINFMRFSFVGHVYMNLALSETKLKS